jgi:hypothetical protein
MNLSFLRIKSRQWDDTRYSFLSKAQQGLDTLMLLFCSTEFLLFLLLDKDDYTYLFKAGKMSVSIYSLLFITYIMERVLFALYRMIQNGFPLDIEDVADSLIVLFLGPYYQLRMSFPYETRTALYRRIKLELFGFVINVMKLSMLFSLASGNGTYRMERQLGVVVTCSALELLCTAKNVMAVMLSDIPKNAYDREESETNGKDAKSDGETISASPSRSSSEPYFVVVVKQPRTDSSNK